MATCLICNQEYDRDNETQPCCECGYPLMEDYSERVNNSNEEDPLEYYEQILKDNEEKNVLLEKEIEILKNMLSILKANPDDSKIKVLNTVANVSELFDFETEPFNKILNLVNNLPWSSKKKLIALAKNFYNLENKIEDEEPEF